jgi:hypothetical protein
MPVTKIRNIMGDHPVLVDVRGMIKRADAELNGIYYQCL